MKIMYIVKSYTKVFKMNDFSNRNFIELDELIKKLFFNYDDRVYSELKNEFNLSIEQANVFLRNLKYVILLENKDLLEYEKIKYNRLKEIYDFLLSNKLITEDIMFKNYLKTFKLVFWDFSDLDKDSKLLLKDLDINFERLLCPGDKSLDINLLKDKESEYVFIIEDIFKKNNLTDTYIVKDYLDFSLLSRIASLYNLEIYEESTLFEYEYIRKMYESPEFRENENHNKNTNLDFKAKLKIEFNKLSNKYEDKEVLLHKLKTTKFNKNVIKFISYKDSLSLNGKNIYITNFNEYKYPFVHKNEGYFLDKTLSRLDLQTTIELNNYEKLILDNVFNCDNNYVVTARQIDDNKHVNVSSFSSNVIDRTNDSSLSNYSNNFNKVILSKQLDQFYKYSSISDSLSALINTYGNNYNTYDNKFKNFDVSYDKNSFSYTALEEYAECEFKFFVNRILKIDKFDTTVYTVKGNIYHEVLEKIYETNFNFKDVYKGIYEQNIKAFENVKIEDRHVLSKQEAHLEEVIEKIIKQDDLIKHTSIELEKNLILKIDDFDLEGIVDKIYLTKNAAIVVDYKSGSTANVNLSLLNEGINLQLPIYALLIKELYGINISGVYLHLIGENKKQEYKLSGLTVKEDNLINFEDKDNIIVDKIKINVGGEFSKASPVISRSELNDILDNTKEIVTKIVNRIKSGSFNTNPLNSKHKKSCAFCSFKDLCYVTFKDYRVLDEEDDENEMD